MSTTYYLKHLRLAPAELANELDIPAEAPVFLSPVVNAPQRCSICAVTYSPLLYAPGHVTYSQHYHGLDGGIYFLVRKETRFTKSLFHPTGWLAQVEPIGKTAIYETSMGRLGIAEAVSCTGIAAWCLCSEPEIRRLIRRPHKRHLLDSGVLLGWPYEERHLGMFVPVCEDAVREPHAVAFRFQIRDGTVYFSQPLAHAAR